LWEKNKQTNKKKTNRLFTWMNLMSNFKVEFKHDGVNSGDK